MAFKPVDTATGAAADFPFFVACVDSSLFSVTPQGCTSVAFLPSTAHTLLFTPEGDALLAITQTMNAFFYDAADGSAVVRREMKLAGRAPHAFAWVCCCRRVSGVHTWQIGANTLAAATGDSVVRVWDFENDENFLLSVVNNGVQVKDISFSAIAFDPARRIIAAGLRPAVPLAC